MGGTEGETADFGEHEGSEERDTYPKAADFSEDEDSPSPCPSPHDSRRDQVRIKTAVKSAETIKYVTVDRKMPMAELKRLPEVKTLKDDYGLSDHTVDASPARSGTSVPMTKS